MHSSRKKRQWLKLVEERIARQELETSSDEFEINTIKSSFERGEPCAYYGAIGGAYDNIFNPISKGLIFKVRNNEYVDEIDVTDFDAIGDVVAAEISKIEYATLLE